MSDRCVISKPSYTPSHSLQPPPQGIKQPPSLFWSKGGYKEIVAISVFMFLLYCVNLCMSRGSYHHLVSIFKDLITLWDGLPNDNPLKTPLLSTTSYRYSYSSSDAQWRIVTPHPPLQTHAEVRCSYLSPYPPGHPVCPSGQTWLGVFLFVPSTVKSLLQCQQKT